MGCGSSKAPLSDAPDITPINVPDTEPGYPEPKPPTTKKREIFREEKYQIIDEKSSKITVNDEITYEELLATITQDLNTDLEKLRAIFYFVGSQDIEKQYYPGVTDPYTPRGYMKLIKLKKGYYYGFFALLCRAAGLPCVVIRGKGKSVGYEVGDQDVSDLHSSWNAVYVDRQWRLVHPSWAFTGITGYNSGRWMQIEEQGEQTRERAKASKGTHVSGINEYWFLTNPDEFVYFCIADSAQWQLHKEPWTVEKFVEVPFFRPPYFTRAEMALSTAHKAVLVAEEGKVEIKFDHDVDCKSDIAYKLFFDEEESSEQLPDENDLPRCVFFESTEKEKRLVYRFHVKGVYKTVLYCGGTALAPIVSFKIECSEAASNPNLFPVNPPIGYGYGHTAKESGLVAPSETEGVVQTDKNNPTKFEFRLDRMQELKARLLHNDFTSEELQKHIQQETEEDRVKFSVSVPEHPDNGEFALQIYSVQGDRMDNVVNYLLTDKKNDFSADNEEERQRLIMQLKNAMNGDDIDELETAIREFEEADIHDEDGDLPRARNRLKELRKIEELKRRLKNAMLGDDPEELEAAIPAYESAGIPDDEGDLAAARERLQELRRKNLGEDEKRRLLDNLRKAMDRRNIKKLEEAISECEQNGLSEDEDVLRARQLLVDLYEQALEQGMAAHDVEEVQRLVNSAKRSPVAQEMEKSDVMEEAERFLRQQARLQKYLSVVLELNQSTVSEIHRYPNPKPASFNSVVATYLILGEEKKRLQRWNDIRNLLRLTGRKGIVRRIKTFNIDHLDVEKAEQAKKRLDKYTLDEVRIISAGAAAFYEWSSNIVAEELNPEEFNEETSEGGGKDGDSLSEELNKRESPRGGVREKQYSNDDMNKREYSGNNSDKEKASSVHSTSSR